MKVIIFNNSILIESGFVHRWKCSQDSVWWSSSSTDYTHVEINRRRVIAYDSIYVIKRDVITRPCAGVSDDDIRNDTLCTIYTDHIASDIDISHIRQLIALQGF